MATLYRNTGNDTNTFPLNPSFPSGGQSQDLNFLTIVTLGTTSNGTWQRPNTPSGWTLLKSSKGDNWNTVQYPQANVTIYMYTKVGAFTGPLGNITWNGVGSMPLFAIAGIDIFGCAASETWDVDVYSVGGDPTFDYSYNATANKFGTNGNGRIDPGPDDMYFIVSGMNTANSGYPIAEQNALHTTTTTGKYTPGAGVSGTYTNVDNSWVGPTGNLNDGLTLIRSHFKVSSVKPPFGSPKFETPLYNPGPGITIHVRVGLRQKASSDVRTIKETLKIFGLSSADTSTGTEGSRNWEPLNANRDFEEIEGVANWTAQNGAQIARSVAQFHLGTSSMLVTPDGVTSTPQVISEELTIIPNSYYYAHSWLRGNGETLNHGIFWYNASHTKIGESMINFVSVAGQWKEYEVWAPAPAGARYARIAINGTGVIASSDPWYVDEAYIADGSVRNKSNVPYPRRWKNGDVPTAEMLNKDWRETFRWLLGYTKPWFAGISTNTTNWTVGTWHPLPINTETLKQGGMVHVANDTKIYVPEDGWYEVLAVTSRDSTAAGTTAKDYTSIRRNGTGGWGIGSHEPHLIDLDKVNSPDHFSLYLSAGDYVELAVWSDATSGTVKSWNLTDTTPRIEIWWAER